MKKKNDFADALNDAVREDLEAKVDAYLNTWMEAASALKEIKEERLYLFFIKDDKRHTWREYCQQRFHCTAQWANKMIALYESIAPTVKSIDKSKLQQLPQTKTFWSHCQMIPDEKRVESINNLFTEDNKLQPDWKRRWFDSYSFCRQLKKGIKLNLYKVTRVDDADISPGTDVPISFICTAPDELTARKIIPNHPFAQDPIKDLEDARVGEVGVDGNWFYDDSVHGVEWPAELSKIRAEYLGKSNFDRMVILMEDGSGC